MLAQNEQIKQLHAALLSAFPTVAGLRTMVGLELDENLDSIAGGDNTSEKVFNLIEWAKARGQLENLIEGAYRANPKNPELIRFVKSYTMDSSTAVSGEDRGNGDSGPTDEQIEKVFRENNRLVIIRGASPSDLLSRIKPIYEKAMPEQTTYLHTDIDSFSDTQLRSEEVYFKALALDIAGRLSIGYDIKEHWKKRLGPSLNMHIFVRNYVLNARKDILFWRMFNVDRLLNRPFSDAAFSFFRVLYTEGWNNLILVLCCQADPNTFIKDSSRSPFNVGVRLEFEEVSKR